MTYEQFLEDPFGLKKQAKHKEQQQEKLRQIQAQQALDREERMRSQMANGEIGREAEGGLDSSNSAQKTDGVKSGRADGRLSSSLKVETGLKKREDDIPTDVILTLSTSI